MTPDPKNPLYVDASFYNRHGRRAAAKAERIMRNKQRPRTTKPKRRK